ncbi:MAG: AAC(3) family N-acetyltransferase [Tepidisphaeraceae bacterium]
MNEVTKPDILAAIRSLGVTPGDLLLAHTSLSSFGRVEGGAVTVAQALIASVSPGGTAFVPTFNYGTLPYDPAITQSLTGAVTEAFWKLPGAVRSGHPTHAVAGFGPDAQAVLADHETVHPFGRGSPLWRLWERDAWVLLIGCDHRSSSMVHVAEEAMDVPQLDRTRSGQFMRGSEVTEVNVRRPGCSGGFNIVDGPLRSAEKIREGTVGRSRFMLMRAADIVAAASELLRRDATALLCTAPDCERCAWAREKISEHFRRT